MKLSESKPKSSKKEEKKNTLKKNRPDSDDESDDYETLSEDDDDLEDTEEEDTDDDDDDSSYHPPVRKSNTNQKGKKVVESDEEDSEEDEEMDNHELQKFISKIFPSKYMDEKVAKKKTKKTEKPEKKEKKEKTNLRKKSTKKAKKEEEEDSDDDEEEEDDPEDRGFEDEADEQNFYSIIFGEEEDDECAYIEEEEDAECDSDDEEAFMKENYQKLEPVGEAEQEKSVKPSKKAKVSKKKQETVEEELADVEHEYLELVETKKVLVEQLRKKPKSKVLRNAVSECNRSIKKLIKKGRTKNAKTYHKLIHDDKKRTNEIDYFKKKLSNKEQLRVMKDLKEINKHVNIEKPYRLTLLDSKMPPKFKAIALQKLNVLRTMEPGDNEYYKIKNWIDTFMRVPFGVYKSLSVNIDDGMDKCNEFMENAKQTLDVCTHGLNDAKMQIMQFMGQWIANPAAMGSAIAIHGPPGTGKCLGLNTPILMYDGTMKMVQDIVVGDVIMGDNSTPRNILALGRGQDEMYDIISKKGDKYTVNSEHILSLKPSGLNRIKQVRNINGTIGYKAQLFDKNTYKLLYKTFKTQKLAESQFDEAVIKKDGFILHKPVDWT